MATFFCKLVPPRPTFALDMSADERSLMLDHNEYWKRSIESGGAIAFGLVADPTAPYGIGIVELEDETAAPAVHGRRSRHCGEQGVSLRDFPYAVRCHTPLIRWTVERTTCHS